MTNHDCKPGCGKCERAEQFAIVLEQRGRPRAAAEIRALAAQRTELTKRLARLTVQYNHGLREATARDAEVDALKYEARQHALDMLAATNREIELSAEVARLREALEVAQAALQPNTIAWRLARAALKVAE